MNVEVEVPEFENDASDKATVGEWRFDEGDLVLEDEVLVELHTEHETHDIHAPVTGILVECQIDEEDVVHVGDVLAVIEVAEEDEAGFEDEEDLGYGEQE